MEKGQISNSSQPAVFYFEFFGYDSTNIWLAGCETAKTIGERINMALGEFFARIFSIVEVL